MLKGRVRLSVVSVKITTETNNYGLSWYLRKYLIWFIPRNSYQHFMDYQPNIPFHFIRCAKQSVNQLKKQTAQTWLHDEIFNQSIIDGLEFPYQVQVYESLNFNICKYLTGWSIIYRLYQEAYSDLAWIVGQQQP